MAVYLNQDKCCDVCYLCCYQPKHGDSFLFFYVRLLLLLLLLFYELIKSCELVSSLFTAVYIIN